MIGYYKFDIDLKNLGIVYLMDKFLSLYPTLNERVAVSDDSKIENDHKLIIYYCYLDNHSQYDFSEKQTGNFGYSIIPEFLYFSEQGFIIKQNFQFNNWKSFISKKFVRFIEKKCFHLNQFLNDNFLKNTNSIEINFHISVLNEFFHRGLCYDKIQNMKIHFVDYFEDFLKFLILCYRLYNSQELYLSHPTKIEYFYSIGQYNYSVIKNFERVDLFDSFKKFNFNTLFFKFYKQFGLNVFGADFIDSENYLYYLVNNEDLKLIAFAMEE
jgi:hypothetical protein